MRALAPVPALTSRATPPLRWLARFTFLFTFTLTFTLTSTSHAQLEAKTGAYNTLYRGTVPNSPSNTPPILPTQPQFAGVGVTGASQSAVSAATTPLTARYPSQVYLAGGNGAPTGAAIIQLRATLGVAFVTGAPRYLFGDVITPPTTDDAGAPLAADSNYWRVQPIRPGETFTHLEGPQDPAPKVAAGTTPTFYYSPHAEKTFASQSGRVTITWVSRLPVASGTDGRLRYRYREETFGVSSATQKTPRTIFWTERSFNGPTINVPTGNIEAVNPIYNTPVPALVSEEYKPVGVSVTTDPSITPPAEKRTLWFEKTAGIGQLHAYNVEGRLMVEYLGKLKSGSNNVHTFLGADIVEIVRVAPTVNTEVNLGERLLPRDLQGRALPLDGSSEWVAAPVASLIPDGKPFYGSTNRPDGIAEYYAERENTNPDRVIFYWLERANAAIPADTGPGTTAVNLLWPKAKNAYAMSWPTGLAAYAHNTVAATGSTTFNGIQFAPGQLPQVVFQDDTAQTESRVDAATQRFIVSLPTGPTADGLNRTLLKFSNGAEVWYVRLYTQADTRSGFQQSDGTPATFTATARVGERLLPPSSEYSLAGHIETGPGFSTSYFPAGYIEPLTAGITAAERGAIIPVNALPGANTLKVWWLKKVSPLSASFAPFYVPAKVGLYTISYPTNPREIVLASNIGSGDLAPSEIAGALYIQNDRANAGFNPNEEHALMLNGRIYALRDDLNNTSSDPATFTSQPFALLSYTSPVDQRPAMSVFKILRENDTYRFDYPITAGTIVQAPMPLPLMPLPLGAGGKSKNLEVDGVPDTAHQGPSAYTKFTFEDRKGYNWVYRGPHAGGSPTMVMQFYYTMRDGFYIPGVAQPAVGTALPYLRPLSGGAPQGHPVSGTALSITYRPRWPESAPTLRVAETLTLPKFGLPAVLGQASAEIFYQQSIANEGAAKPSVVLHDPIREKVFTLGGIGDLPELPTSILTTASGGKVYFQRLPAHLQTRFFFDPSRGVKGALVLLGKFVDEIAGDDYLQLNTLSPADRALLDALPASSDANRSLWLAALTALTTKVETFVEDPNRLGSYKPDGSPVDVGPMTLPLITNADTAVAGYAVTANGAGSGWVTMLFGNGRAFTPVGDPVSVQVFRVTPQLYTGDIKVLPSKNPLDEQVTLRHSGDYAAHPELYDFEWRYAPPQDGKAPPTYLFSKTSRLENSWEFVQTPAGARPTAAEYAAGFTSPLPRTVQIRAEGSPAGTGTTRPGLVIRSLAGVDFSAGVPAQVFLGAEIADLTGFVLYVNSVPALAYQAPAPFTNTPASTGLVVNGLPRQFEINASYFQKAVNRLEIALYTTADLGNSSGINFELHGTVETDLVAVVGSPWQLPNGTLTNEVVVGGSPTAPLGSPLLVMSDNFFTMRYRPKASAGSVAGTDWSRWIAPQLVEGWIKRVLAGINPFNQRVSDLSNNTVNTDVSILTQAGKRWEGNIALTLDSIDSFGLIEIYETVLNRAKAMSIDSGYDYGAANDALLLAAGYLNDLYTVLGNEAYADAANPTISIDDSSTITEVNTSRFSFEGQVSNVLEEELSLLRGRDDFNTAVDVSPAYNRLYWNYTRGINSGEALYATNYNIREKVGSPTADGKLDAADAQRMFPQAHGDAYGHYLTAIGGYYRLLTNPFFTWTPRSENVTVLGRTVAVDYFDERKFAEAGVNLARTAQQVVTLTHRQNYKDDPASGWSHFRDGKVNSGTGVTRQWGLDEWSARAAQGAYFNWVVGNALLPDKDTDPNHTGVQIIDRSTVPALQEIPALGESFQSAMDNANAHLNPLGLSPGAIAFDISGADLKAGKSHYEQIYDRALRATLNAKGAFDQAGKMTRLLRSQENQLDGSNAAIVDQERAYVRSLKEIYGTPYTSSVGVGKTYAQGYVGPDLYEWFIVDRATGKDGAFIDSSATVTITAPTRVNVHSFTEFNTNDILLTYVAESAIKTLTIEPNRYVQFSDVWLGGASMGQRAVVGTLQQALTDADQARTALIAGNARLQSKLENFFRRHALFVEMVRTRSERLAAEEEAAEKQAALALAQAALIALGEELTARGETAADLAEAAAEAPPKAVGLANDATSGARSGIMAALKAPGALLKIAGAISIGAAGQLEGEIAKVGEDLEGFIEELGFNYQQAQVAYEFSLMYHDLMREFYEIIPLATNLQRANEKARTLIAEGQRIQDERELFRQRAAALIQGYRTKDLTFRTFRNEALEQYRSLFDLASRYTYLAAKSYDYETGLLGSATGRDAINRIVASRALGDLTGGTPQATVSTFGDAGLAGTMARIQADWAVAKGRLGINNPDQNGTLFSLRRELFRLLDDPTRTDDDAAWQQTLEQHIVSNLLADPDIAAQCRNIRKPDGSAIPGIVIPFRTTIEHGQNFFGLPLAGGDNAFSPSNYATKIYSVGMVLRGYVGMNPYSIGVVNAGTPASNDPKALSASPYLYLIPTGTDYMLAPPLGDTGAVRAFNVADQALPLPFNLGATAFSTTQFYNANGTLSEQPWILRKHQAFRPVSDPAFFYSSIPSEFTSSRLVGRSAWNGGWKIVIPAYSLLASEQEGLNRFVSSVKDIELFLRTYSHSGN